MNYVEIVDTDMTYPKRQNIFHSLVLIEGAYLTACHCYETNFAENLVVFDRFAILIYTMI